MIDPLLTTAEAMHMAHISRSTLQQWIHEGRLTPIRAARRRQRFIAWSELQKYCPPGTEPPTK